MENSMVFKSLRLLPVPCLLASALLWPFSVKATALDDYVNKPDPNYQFNVVRDEDSAFAKTYIVHMTSQQWRDETEVDRPLWEHDLIITVPRTLIPIPPFDEPLDKNSTAIMLISGGKNGPDPVDDPEALVEIAAQLMGAVIVEFKQVPNQPLSFTDEVDNPRKEDEILAYSMDKFLDTGDPEWPVHLPMTKATVRAMDTIQRVLQDEEDITIDDFLVLGGSKRGWTTWLTAAVDDRIKAIVPASIDMLNLGRQFQHHWEAYGFFAPAVGDYAAFDLPCRIQTPNGLKLLDSIDPYSYIDRYQGLPKLIVNSAGDQFFVSDSSQFYYDDMPAPFAMRYSVNTDHSQDEDVLKAGLAWIDDALQGRESAQPFSWSFQPDGSIRVEVERTPKTVKLWQASNPDARDFRMESIGKVWTSTTLAESESRVYTAQVEQPAQGWTAFLIELTFDEGGAKPDQVFTTGVRVTPDTLPFAGTFCKDWMRVLNTSSRGQVGPASSAIQSTGFIVSGSGSKKFLIKGEGTILGLPDSLTDSVLRLVNLNTGAVIDENDNWRDHPSADQVAAFAPPADDREAAFIVELQQGQYVAELSGKDGASGIGLVAVTEVDQETPEPKLLNVSNNGQVGTGEATLRAGFIVSGQARKRFLIKGEGAILNRPDAITDPVLRVYNLSTGETIAENDNWRDHPLAEEIEALAPPSDNREAAMILELELGVYVAELRNLGTGTQGIVAITEVPGQ